MLVLTRKSGQSIYIGDDIRVTVVDVKGGQVRLGIDAPSDKKIFREEIYTQIKDQNQKAAHKADPGKLRSLSKKMSGGSSSPAQEIALSKPKVEDEDDSGEDSN